MPGVAVKGRDRAGGVQREQAHDWFVLESEETSDGDAIVTIGDTVEPHGDAPHAPAPVMVEGESWFLIEDSPVSRAEHLASCGDRTTGRHWFQLESADCGFRPFVLNPGDICNVEHIPSIMRAKGWYEGAKLMDRWFTNDPSTDKSLAAPDTTTITMDFVLRYADSAAAYEDLKDPAGWTAEIEDIPGVTPLQRLCSHLAADNKLTNTPQEFDYLTGSAPDLKKYWVDHAIVEHTELDGLLASLGRFEMFLVLAGSVEPVTGGGHKITITRSGVFVEDDYDFERFQFLGFWDIRDHSVTNDLVEGIFLYPCPVFNSNFKKGGDYLIYSDLKLHEYRMPPMFFC